jgi:hypothetical protein
LDTEPLADDGVYVAGTPADAVRGAGIVVTMLAAKDTSLVAESALLHALDLPVFETIAMRLGEGAAEHSDEDCSATYLTSAPYWAA